MFQHFAQSKRRHSRWDQEDRRGGGLAAARAACAGGGREPGQGGRRHWADVGGSGAPACRRGRKGARMTIDLELRKNELLELRHRLSAAAESIELGAEEEGELSSEAVAQHIA